jgi:succinyl-diaminopimelate desuccinylase
MNHAEERYSLMAPSEAIAAARQAQPALVEMTRQLVRIDSQTPPSDTRLAAKVAMGHLSELPGIDISWHPSEPPVMNAVARLSGGLPGPRLVLSGHLDT